jgi:tetratricopeptide (TPR) repeat protein
MRILITLFLLLTGVSSLAQNELLARNYAEKGEYEKAIAIYEKLAKQTPGRLDYTLSLVEMNQQVERFDKAQKLLEERLNTRSKLPQLIVELGHNYTLQNKDS